MEGVYISIIRPYMLNPQLTSDLLDRIYSSKIMNKTRLLFSLLLSNTVLKVLSKQGKKKYQKRKDEVKLCLFVSKLVQSLSRVRLFVTP